MKRAETSHDVRRVSICRVCRSAVRAASTPYTVAAVPRIWANIILPRLLVGTRAARPVQVVIRAGRDIYRHCRQPGGPLGCAGELAHRAGEFFGFSVYPRSGERAQRPMSAPGQLAEHLKRAAANEGAGTARHGETVLVGKPPPGV